MTVTRSYDATVRAAADTGPSLEWRAADFSVSTTDPDEAAIWNGEDWDEVDFIGVRDLSLEALEDIERANHPPSRINAERDLDEAQKEARQEARAEAAAETRAEDRAERAERYL